jgi:hypothetical protein
MKSVRRRPGGRHGRPVDQRSFYHYMLVYVVGHQSERLILDFVSVIQDERGMYCLCKEI